MLKAVYSACKTSGQFSFEERMGCGFGACMGCSCKTKYGLSLIHIWRFSLGGGACFFK